MALPDDVKQYVDDGRVFATLATILPDGRPHLTVVWVKRDDDDLLVSTTVDRQQAKNMMRDPRVTLVISAPDNPYLYAEVRGNVSLTPDPGRELPTSCPASTRSGLSDVLACVGQRRRPTGRAHHPREDHGSTVKRRITQKFGRPV